MLSFDSICYPMKEEDDCTKKIQTKFRSEKFYLLNLKLSQIVIKELNSQN